MECMTDSDWYDTEHTPNEEEYGNQLTNQQPSTAEHHTTSSDHNMNKGEADE